MIANIQGSVLNTIGSNQYAQVTRTNGTAENHQIKDSRVDVMPVQAGAVRTSVDGDVLTISPLGNAYADRAADVTAGVLDESLVSQISGTATDEKVKAFVPAEEKEAEERIRREETPEEKRKERMEDLKDEDLSGYTDSELAGMLSRGEITRTEYETETKSREDFAALAGLGA